MSIELSGWLEKQSPSLLQSWQSRFFKLVDKGTTLAYWKNPPSYEDTLSEPSGSINLGNVFGIRIKNGRQFTLITDSRDWVLSAFSAGDKDRWIEVLSKSITFIREDRPLSEEKARNQFIKELQLKGGQPASFFDKFMTSIEKKNVKDADSFEQIRPNDNIKCRHLLKALGLWAPLMDPRAGLGDEDLIFENLFIGSVTIHNDFHTIASSKPVALTSELSAPPKVAPTTATSPSNSYFILFISNHSVHHKFNIPGLLEALSAHRLSPIYPGNVYLFHSSKILPVLPAIADQEGSSRLRAIYGQNLQSPSTHSVTEIDLVSRLPAYSFPMHGPIRPGAVHEVSLPGYDGFVLEVEAYQGEHLAPVRILCPIFSMQADATMFYERLVAYKAIPSPNDILGEIRLQAVSFAIQSATYILNQNAKSQSATHTVATEADKRFAVLSTKSLALDAALLAALFVAKGVLPSTLSIGSHGGMKSIPLSGSLCSIKNSSQLRFWSTLAGLISTYIIQCKTIDTEDKLLCTLDGLKFLEIALESVLKKSAKESQLLFGDLISAFRLSDLCRELRLQIKNRLEAIHYKSLQSLIDTNISVCPFSSVCEDYIISWSVERGIFKGMMAAKETLKEELKYSDEGIVIVSGIDEFESEINNWAELDRESSAAFGPFSNGLSGVSKATELGMGSTIVGMTEGYIGLIKRNLDGFVSNNPGRLMGLANGLSMVSSTFRRMLKLCPLVAVDAKTIIIAGHLANAQGLIAARISEQVASLTETLLTLQVGFAISMPELLESDGGMMLKRLRALGLSSMKTTVNDAGSVAMAASIFACVNRTLRIPDVGKKCKLTFEKIEEYADFLDSELSSDTIPPNLRSSKKKQSVGGFCLRKAVDVFCKVPVANWFEKDSGTLCILLKLFQRITVETWSDSLPLIVHLLDRKKGDVANASQLAEAGLNYWKQNGGGDGPIRKITKVERKVPKPKKDLKSLGKGASPTVNVKGAKMAANSFLDDESSEYDDEDEDDTEIGADPTNIQEEENEFDIVIEEIVEEFEVPSSTDESGILTDQGLEKLIKPESSVTADGAGNAVFIDFLLLFRRLIQKILKEDNIILPGVSLPNACKSLNCTGTVLPSMGHPLDKWTPVDVRAIVLSFPIDLEALVSRAKNLKDQTVMAAAQQAIQQKQEELNNNAVIAIANGAKSSVNRLSHIMQRMSIFKSPGDVVPRESLIQLSNCEPLYSGWGVESIGQENVTIKLTGDGGACVDSLKKILQKSSLLI